MAHASRASPPRAGQDRSRRRAVDRARRAARPASELGPAAGARDSCARSAMLELQRRRFVRDRTQAIQRLRADWTQHDPVSRSRHHPLRPPTRAAQAQADQPRRQPRRADRGALHPRARPRHRGSQPTASQPWTARSPSCSPSTATRSRISKAPAPTSPPRSSPKPATFAASATPAPSHASAAPHPIPCGSGQTSGRHRLHRGGNRQLNAALYRIAIVQQRHHPDAKTYLARKIAEGKTPARSPPRPQTPPRQRPLPPALRLGRKHAPSTNLLT